jgi:hypothetical protein
MIAAAVGGVAFIAEVACCAALAEVVAPFGLKVALRLPSTSLKDNQAFFVLICRCLESP